MSMRKIIGLIVVMFAVGCLALAAAPDFSGKWVMNKDKSDYRMGREGGTPDITMTIEQSGDTMKVKQQVKSEMGDRENEYSMKTTGEQIEIPGFGNRNQKGTAKWDGNILVVDTAMEMERDGQTMTIKSNDRWELSGDGKTLTISGTRTTPMGERQSKRVFEKQ